MQQFVWAQGWVLSTFCHCDFNPLWIVHAQRTHWPWKCLCRHPGQNEQDVMQIIRPELDTFTISLGVNIRYLPTVMYSSFCEMPKELDQLKTIHPNCCPQGLDAKLRVLRRSLEDYDWIMSLPVSFSKQLGSHDFQWIKPQCWLLSSASAHICDTS